MLQKSIASFFNPLSLDLSLSLIPLCVDLWAGGLGGLGAFICPSGAFMSTFKFGEKSWVGTKDRRAMTTVYI